jgi:uncharacterized protein YutE (UPF0331/DUF86 family)
MIGFRNLLFHDYASISKDIVYEFLQTRLQDFEIFINYISKWLKEAKKIRGFINLFKNAHNLYNNLNNE